MEEDALRMKALHSLRDELPSPAEFPGGGITLVMGEKREYRAELASELGIKLVTSGLANQLTVWSSHTNISLQKFFLSGDSLEPGHRWTLKSQFLKADAECHPAVMEDRLDERIGLLCGSTLRYPYRINWNLFIPDGGGTTVIDFDGEVDLDALRRLRTLAIGRKCAVFVCGEARQVRGIPYEDETFASLAMAICVKKGIELASCADQVVALRPKKDMNDVTPTDCAARLLRPNKASLDFQFLCWAHSEQLRNARLC